MVDSEVVAIEMHETVTFSLGGLIFEYDSAKEQANIRKHGISFRTAARVFFDENYIEALDPGHSEDEPRYDIIGDTSAGNIEHSGRTIIGNVVKFVDDVNDILYVVYTERVRKNTNGKTQEIIRLISARLATNFERGLYYGQYI